MIVGEMNEMKIVENIKVFNESGVRMINLGVGFDVNSCFFD